MGSRLLGLSLLCGFAIALGPSDSGAQASPLDATIGALDWSATGTGGLISGDYQSSEEATDSEIGASPIGSALVGYVTTFEGIVPDPENGIASVSPLILFPDDPSGFTHTNGSKTTSSSFTAQSGDSLTLYFNYVSTDGLDYRDYAWARLVESGTNATAAWLFLAQSGNAPDGDGTSDYVHDKVLKLQTDPVLANQDQDAILNGGQPVVGMPAGSINVWAPLQEPDGQCWAKDPNNSSCGATGWVESDYVIPDAGSYYLEFGVMNWGDEQFQSALAFDFAGLARPNFVEPITVFETGVPEPGTAAPLFAGLVAIAFNARRRSAPSSGPTPSRRGLARVR